LAEALLEWESLDGDQIDRVIKGEKLVMPQKPQPPPAAQPQTVHDELHGLHPLPEPSKA
jgi:hypothetical protein